MSNRNPVKNGKITYHDAGKGSTTRPLSGTQEHFEKEWNRIFGERKTNGGYVPPKVK